MNKKFNIYFLLTISALYCQITNSAAAENVSTPDPTIQIFPDILINEVGFKDSAHDWIELYIKDDMNSGLGANINGLKINDDSDFFKITNDLTMHTNDYIIINFKSETENFSDVGNLITFNIKRSGLTGTTEQVVIKNALNEVTDAVCWTNSTPTESEISDFYEISEVNQWTKDISTCISSDGVPNNNSIYRKNLTDTNSKNDWAIQSAPTKGKTNIIAAVPTQNATPDPVTANSALFTADSTSSLEDEETDMTAPQIKNTCETIDINEFLPNPEGTDTENEWIELYNPGGKCVMDGWSIDDTEGGSKPFYIYNETVQSGGFLLLPSWKTKISLNNNEDSVRLFNFKNEPAEIIDYANSKENLSYSRNNDNEFEWTSELSPLGKNIFTAIEDSEEEKKDAAAASKSAKTSAAVTIKNGDLSDGIHINELFPNPKGTDKGNEWIEIHNDSDEKVNLGGWYMDLGEGSSKKYTFDNVSVGENGYLVLSDAEMGLTLKNSNGEIRLFDFEDKMMDTITYESSAENSSFMKIKIISEEEEFEWKWTANITKGEGNEVLYKYSGIIMLFDEKTGLLEIKLSGSDEKISAYVIQPGDAVFAQELKTGAEAEFVFAKNESDEFILEDFNILKESGENEGSGDGSIIYFILSSLPPAGVLGYYGIKKLGLIKLVAS